MFWLWAPPPPGGGTSRGMSPGAEGPDRQGPRSFVVFLVNKNTLGGQSWGFTIRRQVLWGQNTKFPPFPQVSPLESKKKKNGGPAC